MALGLLTGSRLRYNFQLLKRDHRPISDGKIIAEDSPITLINGTLIRNNINIYD